jgi:Domain of unknown function (DUF4118)
VRTRPTDTGPAIGYAVAVLGPIAVSGSLVGIRDEINNTNVALVLVVVVVLAALAGGRGAGAVAAVVSGIAFDFFQTRPYLTLEIDSRDDVETTILLLAIGLIVGELVAWARRSSRASKRGHDEVARLHRVAEQVAAGAEPGAVVQAVAVELEELLALRGCRYEEPPFGVPLPRLERNGAIDARVRHFAGGELTLPVEGVEIPVLGRGRQLGRLVLEPDPDVGVSLEERVVAVALSDQLGAALATRAANNGH